MSYERGTLPLFNVFCMSYRSVAQLVEHRSPKPGAGGSSPSTPAISASSVTYTHPAPQDAAGHSTCAGSYAGQGKNYFSQTCFDKSANLVTGREKKDG